MSGSTAKQRAVLVAYLRTGSYSQAAKQLGINENTARGRVAHLMKTKGCQSVAQLAYRLAVEGFRV